MQAFSACFMKFCLVSNSYSFYNENGKQEKEIIEYGKKEKMQQEKR